MTPKYKRVLLKLSGEAMAGNNKTGLDFDTVLTVYKAVKECRDAGAEIAIVVGHHFDKAFYREPVGMYVGHRHEDGDHQTAVVEVFVLLHLFNHHYASVGSGYYGVLRLALEHANGAAEEVHYKQVERNGQRQHNVERHHVSAIAEVVDESVY